MGLDINIKGLERKDTYHGGYMRFANYRIKIAKSFNEKLGKIYEKQFLNMNYNLQKMKSNN